MANNYSEEELEVFAEDILYGDNSLDSSTIMGMSLEDTKALYEAIISKMEGNLTGIEEDLRRQN